jgi:hypothetical protein
MDGEKIITSARRHLGTPFIHQARVERVGVDCIGLLVLVAKELGIPIVDHKRYKRRPDPALFMEKMRLNLDPVPLVEAAIGDMLVFWYQKRGVPQHLAFKTDIGIIHTYAEAGRVVETAMDKKWQVRLLSAWRFRGIE